MTNDEIDAFLGEQERQLRRKFHRMEFSLFYLLRPAKGMEPFERQKNIWLWECALKHIWGETLSPQARNLWNGVRNIYILDPAGELLSLRQAIRLLDLYRLLQTQLSTIEARMPELHSSPASSSPAPGESAPDGGNWERFGGGDAALAAIGGELKSSCARLEAILIGVQAALQESRRRPLPGSLLARSAPANDANGETASPENIERQIEREIETYQRLERQTATHLR